MNLCTDLRDKECYIGPEASDCALDGGIVHHAQPKHDKHEKQERDTRKRPCSGRIVDWWWGFYKQPSSCAHEGGRPNRFLRFRRSSLNLHCSDSRCCIATKHAERVCSICHGIMVPPWQTPAEVDPQMLGRQCPARRHRPNNHPPVAKAAPLKHGSSPDHINSQALSTPKSHDCSDSLWLLPQIPQKVLTPQRKHCNTTLRFRGATGIASNRIVVYDMEFDLGTWKTVCGDLIDLFCAEVPAETIMRFLRQSAQRLLGLWIWCLNYQYWSNWTGIAVDEPNKNGTNSSTSGSHDLFSRIRSMEESEKVGWTGGSIRRLRRLRRRRGGGGGDLERGCCVGQWSWNTWKDDKNMLNDKLTILSRYQF